MGHFLPITLQRMQKNITISGVSNFQRKKMAVFLVSLVYNTSDTIKINLTEFFKPHSIHYLALIMVKALGQFCHVSSNQTGSKTFS